MWIYWLYIVEVMYLSLPSWISAHVLGKTMSAAWKLASFPNFLVVEDKFWYEHSKVQLLDENNYNTQFKKANAVSNIIENAQHK